MSNNVIKHAIANYLDAVEKKHGAGVRVNTSVEHREGTDLVIKQGMKAPQLIDLGTLYNLTNMLKAG
ncbi:MAG: hypothetical protein COW19_09375 [Zetaproteobacteria bacterium CG12_big_fil_rev_8_21_14_0_65_55_1124]|nr:MAG: hypothetical protein AUJ58_10510 [Zetaproteobacteria bacterium CG1_02_55_237]PIS18461.1 MAG: hypothetical protein COT53_10765 [Zetaproteobacteria bacterium CG08_land_8_20_14_0_20_55_17]PIW42219.1 MAG: hypothetical protein COW19_09375 [Zetaproteobacteria bacterium CG12_big_fil_rev_8_21_14_0_65_55_1124]PIY53788.1 MAG: hypothetical protein COZ01_02660 [Zetaproteobacteria bacterium CG_4_10_14_0_8_um_filter_55_43]PIZ38481.1 MAG: hypothetical protein COY36_06130 [Zetaproteobacteria bacterium 